MVYLSSRGRGDQALAQPEQAGHFPHREPIWPLPNWIDSWGWGGKSTFYPFALHHPVGHPRITATEIVIVLFVIPDTWVVPIGGAEVEIQEAERGRIFFPPLIFYDGVWRTLFFLFFFGPVQSVDACSTTGPAVFGHC